MLALLLPALLQAGALADAGPYIIPLRRETFEQVRQGRTVSRRSAYFGTVSLGAPTAQEFSVVFDTGSGHVVVPSTDCKDATCLEHRRYDLAKSTTGLAVNSDGQPVPDDELGDEVMIGFGTGTLKGQFVREQVCLGSAVERNLLGNETDSDVGERPPCSTVNVVVAVEMSEQPFRSFRFDGLFGLGLSGLTLGPDFSFFQQLANSSRPLVPQFGVFLAGTEDGQGSEIAIGGRNARRFAGPLVWERVAMPELGHWQVGIRAIGIGSEELPLCKHGTCRAVLDTGTSHLGTPRQQLRDLMSRLTVPSPPGVADCLLSSAPPMTFEFQNFSITLRPQDYMQQEPRERRGSFRDSERFVCRPALMPVNFQAPLGPNLFILGEPILRRYYTVYDWSRQLIGFGLVAGARPAKAGIPPDEEEVVMMLQVTLTLRTNGQISNGHGSGPLLP
mmetsp:Transcript_30383/g.87027  ORF Transcript_30383/g.87027 Transcript_30383/m.87027 type:complete len:446 (+) Transcript_30383:73-1410(+)